MNTYEQAAARACRKLNLTAEQLEAGVLGEMVEAIRLLDHRLNWLWGQLPADFHDCAQAVMADSTFARDVLAKTGAPNG